jgi:hypothetical protein
MGGSPISEVPEKAYFYLFKRHGLPDSVKVKERLGRMLACTIAGIYYRD